MKQKKTNRVALLLHWAGEQKVWLFLAVLLAMAGGLCIVVPYIEIYRLMDAAFGGTCTEELVVRVVAAVAAAVVLRFVLFGASGVVSHKGAYGALFKVRCMVAEHMAKVPLGALNERRTGDIKTVLNEDIEKLELFLAHNLPDLVCYLVGPVVVFAYLMTVNIQLALISLVPLVLAVVVMLFRKMESPLGWAVLSGAFGLSFGALCALVYWVTGGWAFALSWWVSGIPFDLLHCAGNFAMALVLFRPCRQVLTRLMRT